MSFTELKVKQEVVKALTEEGITKPTNIQEQAIPLIHNGHDLIGISRTGSGKTASFGIPLIEKIVPQKGVQGLVLAPTRELANQISKEFQKWSKYLNISIATVFGGVAIDPQADKIARSEIVVGTPGRVLDHLSRGTLNLSTLTCFILDEADKMVEMGFIEDIERILSATPKNRQILLFGATISNEIDHIKNTHMHNVAVAEAELHVKKDLLEQYFYNIKSHEKFSLLAHLLKKDDVGRAIIFCSKRSTVELVNKNLRTHGVKAEMIHGKMRQNKRLQVIDRFNAGKTDYLVASAVAARGLDIQGVTHVFNYDLANDPQEYVHRVGRTARAGQSGVAVTLLAPQDHEAFHAIFRRYDLDVEELPREDFPKLRFETQQRRNSHFGGRSRFGNSRPQRSGGQWRGNNQNSRRRFNNHRQNHQSKSGGWRARNLD